MIYIVSIVTTVAFIVYSKHQFDDDKGKTQGKWHPYGMIMRASTFIGAFIMQKFPSSWQDYLLAATLCMLVWEIGINLVALDVKWNHVGTTSKIDIMTRKYHWIFFFACLFISLLIKIFV